MQVVILAAGLGSRLGALTQGVPKALVPVAGEPLLVHALRFARRLVPSEIVVVGGFRFSLVSAELAGREAVTLVENTRFRDGNLLSLLAARPHVRGDFLIMNVDHIYRPMIAEIVAQPVDEVAAFIDTDRTLGADDMKVERDDGGSVLAISKTLDRFDAGYVGMTRVPAVALGRYWAAVDATSAEEGPAVHVERVLARLVATGRPPCCRDISGYGWLEVDNPEERDRADAAVRTGGY